MAKKQNNVELNRDLKMITMYLPIDLINLLSELANKNGVSRSSQIVFILRKYFEDKEALKSATDLRKTIEYLEQQEIKNK